MNDKKYELKKLFYSNLTSFEIQSRLNLKNPEYQKLLKEVKEELGLPSSYRRKPQRYGKYVEDAFFIKKYDTIKNDFEIVTYAPTLEDAETKLQLYDDGVSFYKIEQATNEHMIELIKEDYIKNNTGWSESIRKYQIPYNKYYSLLNIVKEELGIKDNRTNKKTRYIYKYAKNGKYLIRKTIDHKQRGFGYYPTMDIAIRVRDSLEDIRWDIPTWLNEKEKIIRQAENG